MNPVEYRGVRLLRTTLNADIEVIRTKPAEPAWPTRYTRPRLIRTTFCIPDKNAPTNVSVLSGYLCIYRERIPVGHKQRQWMPFVETDSIDETTMNGKKRTKLETYFEYIYIQKCIFTYALNISMHMFGAPHIFHLACQNDNWILLLLLSLRSLQYIEQFPIQRLGHCYRCCCSIYLVRAAATFSPPRFVSQLLYRLGRGRGRKKGISLPPNAWSGYNIKCLFLT